MQEEIWKNIPWYDFHYQISNIWNVRNLNYRHTNKIRNIKNIIRKDWYVSLQLIKNKKQHTNKIHRLVAQAFIPNPENKPQVNHINWIKNDNRVENLEWCTQSENQKHAFHLWLNKIWENNNFKTNTPKPHLWKTWWLSMFSKKINQYDLEWNFIKTWDSFIEASLELGINRWNIWNCCRWKYKTAWWFIWKYYSIIE